MDDEFEIDETDDEGYPDEDDEPQGRYLGLLKCKLFVEVFETTGTAEHAFAEVYDALLANMPKGMAIHDFTFLDLQ